MGIFFEVEPFGHNPAICDGFPAIWYVARPACPAQAPSEVMNQPPPQAALVLFSGKWLFQALTRAKGVENFG